MWLPTCLDELGEALMQLVLLGSFQVLYKLRFICVFLKRGLLKRDIILVTFYSLNFSSCSCLREKQIPIFFGREEFESSPYSRVTADLLLLLLLLSFQSTIGHMMTSRPKWGDDVDKSI